MDRDVERVARLTERVVRVKLGAEMMELEERARRCLPGDEWKLEADRQELLEKMDRIERRLRLELETHVRPDGMVEYAKVLRALLDWDMDADD